MRIEHLFLDPARDGVTNMAVDGCLLEQAESAGAASLRLYRWRPATLSLGYFQRYDDPARQVAGLKHLPVVRRCTGGGAIVHAEELTYSLALPIGHALAGRRPEDLYAWMHRRIAEAVAALGGRAAPKGDGDEGGLRRGPFLCFARHAAYDLMAVDAPGEQAGSPTKLVGSAQRRTRRGVLQHGSIVLARSHAVQPSASVSELTGRPVSFEEMAEALIAAVARGGVALGGLSCSRVGADSLRRQRRMHAGLDWLRRR